MEFIRKVLCMVVLFTVNSLACRCVQKPLHEAFCDADFGKGLRFGFIFDFEVAFLLSNPVFGLCSLLLMI